LALAALLATLAFAKTAVHTWHVHHSDEDNDVDQDQYCCSRRPSGGSRAPSCPFAQAMAFLNTSHQIGLANVPAAVFGSAIAPTQRRAPRTTAPPSDRAVTDPSGNVISLRRDWVSGED